MVEGGWNWGDHEELKKTKERSFQLQCQNLLDTLKKFKSSWPFHEPVSAETVPDYYQIIKDPMDIKTMEAKVETNDYPDKETFRKDIMVMFTNCKHYNQIDSQYYKAALECEAFILPYLDSLKDKKEIMEEEREKRGAKKTAAKGSKSASKKKP